jgi:hypothetical protein
MSSDKPRSFFSPLFVVTAAVLLVTALGMQPVLAALIDRFVKEPIAIRASFDNFDVDALPSFRTARKGHGMRMAEDDPGTEDWFHYVVERDREKGKSGDEVVFGTIFVTYYSDPRDRVPHTPEVCYAQGGATINAIRTITVDTPGLAEVESVRVKLVDLEGSNDIRVAVAYLFCCNGEFYSDRQQVRFAMGWPGDRHVYFSKIEAIVPARKGIDFDEATEHATRLLAETLPELMNNYLPSRDDVR